MRARLVIVGILGLLLLLAFAVWHFRSARHVNEQAPSAYSLGTTLPADTTPASSESASTSVFAHNLMLRRGPDFRIYVRWLRGHMVRTHHDVNPTFDDPESFFLNINSGIVRANIGDIGSFLNAGGVKDSPLKNITLVADGEQIKLKGTLHKLISFPVELLGTVAAAPDNRIQLHVNKLSVLKIPLKGLL